MLYALDGQAPEIDADSSYVAPDAALIGRVRIAAQASVWFNCVLRGDNEWITLGPGSNIQDGSVVHTDPGHATTIGRDVTVGHKVILHGTAIEDEALVGMGCVLLNGSRISSHSILGAGSLVTEGREIPPGVLALGSPARVIRDLTEEEIQLISASAKIYRDNAARFRKGLKPA